MQPAYLARARFFHCTARQLGSISRHLRRIAVDKQLANLHGGRINNTSRNPGSGAFRPRTAAAMSGVSSRALACTFFFMAILFFMCSRADAWHGRVANVLDGDTIEVLNCNGKIVRIHLYGVEAPRATQYYGDRSAQYFSRLVENRPVCVVNVGRDLLGRMRSFVWIDGVSTNEEMVRAGCAWVSNPLGLSPTCERWLDVQQMARASGVGIWNALDELQSHGRVPDLPRSFPVAQNSL